MFTTVEVIRLAHAEVRLLVSPSNHSGYCCVLPLCTWLMERPYCGWKTKLDTSISYDETGLVIVVNTLRADLLCNRLSENSPVFGKPQRIGVRSSLTCASSRNLYILQERCCCYLERPYWFFGRSVIFDYFHFLEVSSRNCTGRRSVCVNVTLV